MLTLTGNVNYNHNINLVDSIRNIGQNWIASQGFVFEYNYKTWLQFGAGASYSINDVTYKKPEGSTSLSYLQNTNSSALTISSNIDITIPKDWVLKYDFDYTFNYGLNSTVSRNQAILTASLEKQMFKKKTASSGWQLLTCLTKMPTSAGLFLPTPLWIPGVTGWAGI